MFATPSWLRRFTTPRLEKSRADVHTRRELSVGSAQFEPIQAAELHRWARCRMVPDHDAGQVEGLASRSDTSAQVTAKASADPGPPTPVDSETPSSQ
jgi:hypothetical protein